MKTIDYKRLSGIITIIGGVVLAICGVHGGWLIFFGIILSD